MALEIFQVDAFSEKPFAGNPAAVCPLSEEVASSWMQNVAREMNLSETAFLRPRDGGWLLRWFTPLEEVDLCGHATLASAHILWETGVLEPRETARFETRSGLLTANRRGDSIEMDFPSEPERPCQAPPGLAEALGVAPLYVGKNRFDYLVEAADEVSVRTASPDFSQLRKIPCRGVILTSRSEGGGADFVSRFFAPSAGVDEDPVTGSAHCCLAPFWSSRLGRTELTGRQLSSRGGTVGTILKGDRVLLIGRAVTVLKMTLLV